MSTIDTKNCENPVNKNPDKIQLTTTAITNDAMYNSSAENVIENNDIDVNVQPSSSGSNVYNVLSTCDLKVIPPKKSIFISRFAYETTTDNIYNYIESKLNCNPDVLIKKFTYSEPRDITSFKLTVPNDLFDTLIDPTFWPNNTFIREYVIRNNTRSNNIVRLTSYSNNVSKN